MKNKHKIFFVLCLTVAMCASILPLFVSATSIFELGKSYQFTPPGFTSIDYESAFSFLGDVYLSGLDLLNDIDVVGFDVSINVSRDDDKPFYDFVLSVLGSGFYSTGENNIPVYYEQLVFVVAQEAMFIHEINHSYSVMVASYVNEEIFILDNYVAQIDIINITPNQFISDTDGGNLNYFTTWFTKSDDLNNPFYSFTNDYIDKIDRFIDVIVSEFGELLTYDNFWSIVVIINAFTFCGALMAIFILFFRRY